jgi:hypothetical protein
MPPASRTLADRSKRRLALYLAKLMTGRSESKNRIGSLVSVNATRVKAWVSGQRYMSPDTAFVFGEALRSQLRWETSGVEFLWVCGHWAEIIEILKYLSADDDSDDATAGPESAVMLYSWLPTSMFEFEKENIERRFKECYDIDDAEFWRRIRLRDSYSGAPVDDLLARIYNIVEKHEPGGREVFRYADDASQMRAPEGHQLVDAEKALRELAPKCQSEAFHARIARAWERYNQGELAVSSNTLAAPVGTSVKIIEIELDFIEAAAHAARKLNEAVFPSYAVPRIWRMIAGWIDSVAPGYDRYIAALPDTFVSASEVQSRSWIDFIYNEYERFPQ